MANTIIFIAFVAFFLYRTYVYFQQVSHHEKETKVVKRTYDDVWGSYAINALYVLIYISLMYAYSHFGLNTWYLLTGFAIIWYSWYIRMVSFKALDKSYGHEIKIFENHKLITTGIYKKVRHPMYARLMLDGLGVAVAANFYITSVLAVLLIIVVLRRISIEDKILVERVGKEAKDYQATVGALNIFQKF